MTIGTIMAIMALFIAFIALWLVSDVLKKVESQNEKFLRAHIKTLRDEMRDIDSTVVKMKRTLSRVEEGVVSAEKLVNEHGPRLDDLANRLAVTAEKLDALDESIPNRFRQRVVKPKEGDAQPQAKPTVQ